MGLVGVALGPRPLNRRPVGTAGPGHVDARDAHVDQSSRRRARDAGPRLLDHHGCVQPLDQSLQRRAHAPPVAVALGLAGLLQRIQMHHQGVGGDHVEHPPRRIDAEPLDQLRRADIGQDRRVRRLQPERHVQPRGPAALQRRALRADGQGDAQLLRRFGQPGVDRLRSRRSAGHGADQQRRLQPPPQKVRAEVDLAVIEVRQSLVHEPHGVEPAVTAVPPAAGQDDIQMLVLAAHDRGHLTTPRVPAGHGLFTQGCFSTFIA